MSEELSVRLGRNIRQLRQARGLTQQQMAKLSGLPRATWSNLESGGGNPTLAVLHAVAMAFQVSLEEIVAEPRASAKIYRRGS
jgi:transcriptional regulator with XRE-family HTH domain